jgi:riboflavin synthase
MFTGIVEELGSVRAIGHDEGAARLEIACTTVLADAVIGASIAINGCCLTVVELDEGWWAADAQPETLARTTLGTLVVGAPVNLERPVRLADRLGGHLVQGHVDGVGRVVDRVPSPDGSVRLGVEVPGDLTRYVVEKGSITIDGVSLTVTEILGDDPGTREPARVGVALIPHTLAHTTLGVRGPGDLVNLEVDMLAKYVERLMAPLSAASSKEP